MNSKIIEAATLVLFTALITLALCVTFLKPAAESKPKINAPITMQTEKDPKNPVTCGIATLTDCGLTLSKCSDSWTYVCQKNLRISEANKKDPGF